MAEPRGHRKPPPTLKFDYGPAGGGRWVIEDLTAGNELRNEQLERIRAEFTVTLVELESADVALSPAKKHNDNANNGGGKGGLRTYVVKKGDTLPNIAANLLGDYKRWREIATLNSIRDPKKIKVGDKLKIPKA